MREDKNSASGTTCLPLANLEKRKRAATRTDKGKKAGDPRSWEGRACLAHSGLNTPCPENVVCDERCPAFALCRKRVLIVGGVERMEALYRTLIEDLGGELDYHSGHLRNGVGNLKRSLRRADIILCPVNCNSHGACLKVKELAKKHNKTFYMLPNGSLNTLSRLLGSEGGGERARLA